MTWVVFVLLGAGCLSHKTIKTPAPIFTPPMPHDNCQDYEDSMRCPLNKRLEKKI